MHVALLRGINVGGKHRLPMAELVTLLEAAGAADVGTYIQSGNAWFTADDPGAVVRGLEGALADRFGHAVPVVGRTLDAVRGALDGCPFLAEGADPSTVHFGFLARAPDAEAVAAMDPDRSPGDRWAVVGDMLYLHLPNGVGRSKLTSDWLDRRLGTTVTVRNHRTVTEIVQRASG